MGRPKKSDLFGLLVKYFFISKEKFKLIRGLRKNLIIFQAPLMGLCNLKVSN
jgi:hypothetical protein